MPSIGLLVIRIFLGASMIAHGYPKLANPAKWEWLGSQMMHIGVNFGYEFFGFLAGSSELLGGVLILSGLFFRPANIVLAFTMFIAFMFHLNQGDGYSATSHSLELFGVFVGLSLIGPGKYSFKKKRV